MIKAIFDGFLIDPRKLMVGGFLLCLITMSAHVMDCEFRAADYLFILLCLGFLLPLFTLGKIDPLIKIDIPTKVAAIFLTVSVVLVIYNIYLIGAPLLFLKIIRGESLEKQYGFYYHHQFKLSFFVWSLLTVLIPMAFYVQSKALKYTMLTWSIVMSTLIQIKMPFLFGFLYVAILFRITGKKIKVLPLVIVGALLTLLFLFVQMTRTAETLTDLGYVVGLSEAWSELDPAIWGPASYLAAPIANALLTMQFEAFRFDLDGILKMLPAFVIDPFGVTYEYTEKFEKLKYVRWYDASNIISGWGHLANNLGVIGMLVFNFLFCALMVISARKNFFALAAVLAAFIVGCRNAALYPVEDYFFEASGLAEFLLFAVCFYYSKIDYTVEEPPDETAPSDPAVTETAVAETAALVATVPGTRVRKNEVAAGKVPENAEPGSRRPGGAAGRRAGADAVVPVVQPADWQRRGRD